MTMQLLSSELKRLKNALLKSFPRHELKELVAFELDEDLDAIAGGANHSEVVLNLLTWAKSRGRLSELVAVAYRERPNDPELHWFNGKLNSPVAPQSVSVTNATFQRFPEVSRFDLSPLIEKCLGELLGKQGLIGIVVPCGEKAFLKNFCDRLKHELGRSNIQIRQPLLLNPQVISVSRAVETISQYKKLLQTSDVICPIRVGVCDRESSIPHDFWQKLQDDFPDEVKHRLIVVMVGSEDCVFPKTALCLQSPRFERVHAFQWIRDITQALDWSQSMDEWLEKMVNRCCDGDPRTERLDVGLVYEHLEYTLGLLQQSPSLSVRDFLEQLD